MEIRQNNRRMENEEEFESEEGREERQGERVGQHPVDLYDYKDDKDQ